MQHILDAITFPASVLTERFDLLAWNAMYAALFPGITEAPPGERNTLLSCLTGPAVLQPAAGPRQYCLALVGQLRAAYGRHVGDPAWTHFIRRLEAVSPAFAQAWAAHEVAQPTSSHQALPPPHAWATITATSTSFAVNAVPGARMVVYTPDDEPSEKALARLAAERGADARFPCWTTHHHPERVRVDA